MTESLLKNKGIRGFIQVLFSNCILILMGVISSFIVPSSITPEEFGYWQTYLLYEAYVGLVLFGYCDGIYLRYGGKEYGQLPKRRFTAFFCIMLLYLVIVCTVFVAIVFSSDMGAKNSCIFYAVAISMLLRCLISFFVLINQATARFNIYSIGNIIEKIFFVCLVIIAMFFWDISMYSLIIISLSGQLLALIYNIASSRELFILPLQFKRGVFKEMKANIAAGFPLTMYGIASMLMTGIGKFSVEHYLGKEQFGYYSFAFPMMAIISQVVAAASLVLFPILKQSHERNIKRLLDFSDKWSIPVFIAVMLVYIPASIIVKTFLPAYTPTLSCLLILLPMIFFQAKITMVYNTILKVKRQERTMMTISFMAVICCAVLTIATLIIHPSLTGIASATTVSYLIWQLLLKRSIRIHVPR